MSVSVQPLQRVSRIQDSNQRTHLLLLTRFRFDLTHVISLVSYEQLHHS